MVSLFIAGLLLPLTHFAISSSALRASLVERIGEQAYRGLCSLVALAAFAWLITAYRGAPLVPLWIAPPASWCGRPRWPCFWRSCWW
jgi:uncharacterized membrane protein